MKGIRGLIEVGLIVFLTSISVAQAKTKCYTRDASVDAATQSVRTASGHALVGFIAPEGSNKGTISAKAKIKSFNPAPSKKNVAWMFRRVYSGGNPIYAKAHCAPNEMPCVKTETLYEILTTFEGEGKDRPHKPPNYYDWQVNYKLCRNTKNNELKLLKRGFVNGRDLANNGNWSCAWTVRSMLMPKEMNRRPQQNVHFLHPNEAFRISTDTSQRALFLTAKRAGGGAVYLAPEMKDKNFQHFWLSDFYKAGMGTRTPRLRNEPGMLHECSAKLKRKPKPQRWDKIRQLDQEHTGQNKLRGFRLKSKYSGLCLTGPLIKLGPRPLQQHPCTKKAYSIWNISLSQGRLRNKLGGAIDRASGDPVKLKKINHKIKQKKDRGRIVWTDKGQIKDWNSKKCLELLKPSKASFVPFVWRSCKNIDRQKFEAF